MDVNSIVTALLTSAAVASVVSTLLETRFTHKFELELEQQRHSYEIELERLKNELTIRAETTHELTERRLAAYSKIVELVYRIRNMAREIANTEDTSSVLFDELRARVRELENSLYTYRMDLERDSVFLVVHAFKNAARLFNRLVEDREHYRSRGEEDQAHKVYEEMCRVYTEIEVQHKPIIDSLSGIIPADSRPG
jgi:hypothetical protein